ncbi:MAG TPA: hypothetical protein PK990_07270 [Salinivirgaceae bacterium]|nr:hypothetical protein [Salinivirgaceae bacterium]
MKKAYSYLLLAFSFLSFSLYSQPPLRLNYQAVVRTGDGSILTNHSLTVRVSIVSETINGTPVYTELNTATSNVFGIIQLVIGEGTPILGTLEQVNWKSSPLFFKSGG